MVLWGGLSALAGSYIIPSPWSTLLETGAVLSDWYNWKQILITLWRVAAGFVGAFLLGSFIGIATGRKTLLEAVFRPVVLFLQGIPPLLWAIPVILLFGIGHVSPVLVITLICLPLVTLNTAQGMKTVPVPLEEMMKVFASGDFPRLKEIVFPHLKPFFSASLKLGITLGIKASVIGEYFGANNGIGFQIQSAYQSLQIRRLFSWGLVLIVLILFSSRLVMLFEKTKRMLSSALQKSYTVHLNAKRPDNFRDVLEGKKPAASFFMKNVSYSYPKKDEDTAGSSGARILERVSINLNENEHAVITGESGTGKTTLLKIAAGILQPQRGNVIRPEKIGFVFQDDRFIPWRTVLENCALPLVYQGFGKRESFFHAHNLLSEFGLKGYETKMPDEISGGMKKRAALARCFLRIPDLVILDEPFSGLHKEARAFLWDKFFHLLEMYPGQALIVTHYPEEVVQYSHLSFYTLQGSPASLKPNDNP